MTKAERRNRLIERLAAAGFSFHEAEQLRRIEMTLSRWAEHECNGTIQRDGENSDGKPRAWYGMDSPSGPHRGPIIADREAGALRRLARLMASHPEYVAYHQGDPRGCALYVVPRDVGDVSSNYTRGIACCD